MSINKNYVNGRWIHSSSEETYQNYNPADLTQMTGIWQKSSIEDTRDAISSAQIAFKPWNSLTVYKRAEYLKRVLKLVSERTKEIANVITTENGKTLGESEAEIRSAIKEMEFQISVGLRVGGEIMPSEHNNVLAYSFRQPLGVVAVISPWNFPFNVPCRKLIPALISGNTCIFKPANLTPGVGAALVKLFEEAQLPAGVLNFITGSGSVIGEELVNNPLIKAITFTGSTSVGMEISKKAANNLIRTQLEMGGKNPMVVLTDADLKAAADSASLAAFACAGQWCTSTSRVIVEEKVVDEFLNLLLTNIKKIVVGKGTDTEVTMGPVCGQSQLSSVMKGIDKGIAEGAKLVTGGGRIESKNLKNGCFIEPTVFTNVKPDMFIAQEEIFGPVLSIISVKSFDQAIEVANNVKFGLSSSVYTRDLQKALTFIRQTDVGLTHVNMPTALKEPQLSFGGVKLSGYGIPEAGHTGIEFFTEHKVVYIKYST